MTIIGFLKIVALLKVIYFDCFQFPAALAYGTVKAGVNHMTRLMAMGRNFGLLFLQNYFPERNCLTIANE